MSMLYEQKCYEISQRTVLCNLRARVIYSTNSVFSQYRDMEYINIKIMFTFYLTMRVHVFNVYD